MPVTGILSRKLREVLGNEATDDLFIWMKGIEAYHASLEDAKKDRLPRIEAEIADLEKTIELCDPQIRPRMVSDLKRLEFEVNALRARTV